MGLATYVPPSQSMSIFLRWNMAALAIKQLVAQMAFIGGLFMCMSGCYRYSIYRRNPIQYPINTVFMTFVLGFALIAMRFIPFTPV